MISTRSQEDPSGGFRIVAELGSDYLGAAVHGAGDVNGDGFDDLIVGAPHHDIGGNNSGSWLRDLRARTGANSHSSGRCSRRDRRVLAHPRERGGDGVSLFSDWGGDGLGFAVSGGADVNNDGLSDIVLGSPYSDAFGENGELPIHRRLGSGLIPSVSIHGLSAVD